MSDAMKIVRIGAIAVLVVCVVVIITVEANRLPDVYRYYELHPNATRTVRFTMNGLKTAWLVDPIHRADDVPYVPPSWGLVLTRIIYNGICLTSMLGYSAAIVVIPLSPHINIWVRRYWFCAYALLVLLAMLDAPEIIMIIFMMHAVITNLDWDSARQNVFIQAELDRISTLKDNKFNIDPKLILGGSCAPCI